MALKHRTLSGKVIDDKEPTSYERAILNGLQSKPVYQGTVARQVIAVRRLHSRMARVSRRVNRATR